MGRPNRSGPRRQPAMTQSASTYVTLTPYGRVDAVFADEHGVSLRGPSDAVAHILRTMDGVTGSGGLSLTVDSVDEHDYLHFCQPEGSRVRILPPASATLDESDTGIGTDDVDVDGMLDSVGDLGPVFTEYEGDPEGAIKRLIQERTGDARAVWERPGIGPIDLVWGTAKAGLAKIVAKHPEAIAKLPDMLRNARLERLPGGKTAVLVDDKNPAHVTVLKLDWFGAAKTWVLTSYDDTNGRFAGGPALIDIKTLDSAGMDCRPTNQRTEGSVVVDEDAVNEPGDDGEDDGTDAVAEFEAAPDEDGGAVAVMDGDFHGHPFRGNQYRKASKESGTAVGASIKAKRAETRGGDAKAQKSAHRGAHHAHMAAAEGATGKARSYHRKMAKFHGKRAGVTLDSATMDRAEPTLINKFSEGDKVICLDDDADYTVTGQRGTMVSLKGRAKAVHANRLKLANGRKPERVALDAADHDWHRRTQEKFRDYNDEQLKFVIKDAREAEELGRKMNPSNPRWGQYLDEISYASMELQRRKKGGKKGDKFDSATEVPGLRVAFGQAGSTADRLVLARKIIESRGSEAVTSVSGIARATPEALTLMLLAQTGGGARNAYAAARAIESAINAQEFEGVTIRWAAVADTEAPAFDAVGSLFCDDQVGTQNSYLRADVSFKGRTFASIYVRGDGSAALVPSDAMSGLDHWESMAETVAESVGGWVNGAVDAEAIADAVAGPRGMGTDVGSLAGVLENTDNLGDALPAADDPEYADDKDPVPTHAQRATAVLDAMVDAGWKVVRMVATQQVNDFWLRVEPEYDDPDGTGPGISWALSKQDASGTTKGDALADNPDVDAQTMVTEIIAAAGAIALAAQQNDAQRLAALEAALPKGDIRSDDPDLIPKLQAKLAALTERSAFMRKANKLIRAKNDAGLRNMGISQAQIDTLKKPDFMGRIGFADYQLSNNNGVIAATRKRLEAAMKAAGAGGGTPGGVDRKAAEEIYSALSYQLYSMRGSSDTERMRPEVEGQLVEKIAALQVLVTGGQWPARSPMDPQALLTRANSVLQGIRVLKANGGPEWVGRGDARSYYVTAAAGLTQEQIEGILNKPDEVTRSGTIDVPSYKVANLKAAVAAALAQNTPAPEPFEHNGRLIYPTVIGGQARWSVQKDENKGTDRRMGDTLLTTREEAIKEADLLDRQAASRAESDARNAENARLAAAAAAAMTDMDGFGDSMGALARGAAQAALWQQQRFNGQVMSRKDFIRQAVADGATVAPHPADTRRINFAGGSYMTQKDIGKTAMDYAEFLITKKGGATPAPNPGPTPEPKPDPTPPVDPQRAADLAILRQIADGMHPDMLAPETADLIEAALLRYPGDAEVDALGERAVIAYSNGLMAATQ